MGIEQLEQELEDLEMAMFRPGISGNTFIDLVERYNQTEHDLSVLLDPRGHAWSWSPVVHANVFALNA